MVTMTSTLQVNKTMYLLVDLIEATFQIQIYVFKDRQLNGTSRMLNVREFLRRLRIETYTLRTPALTARKYTCGSLRLRSCISHTWPISRPHDLHSQYSVVVTHVPTNCSSFYLPGGKESRVKLVRSGERSRTFCTHERT